MTDLNKNADGGPMLPLVGDFPLDTMRFSYSPKAANRITTTVPVPVKVVEPDEPVTCESPDTRSVAVGTSDVGFLIGEINAATVRALQSVESFRTLRLSVEHSSNPRFRRSPAKLPFTIAEGCAAKAPTKRDLSGFIRNSVKYGPKRGSLLTIREATSMSPGGIGVRGRTGTRGDGDNRGEKSRKRKGSVGTSTTRIRLSRYALEEFPAPSPLSLTSRSKPKRTDYY